MVKNVKGVENVETVRGDLFDAFDVSDVFDRLKRHVLILYSLNYVTRTQFGGKSLLGNTFFNAFDFSFRIAGPDLFDFSCFAVGVCQPD